MKTLSRNVFILLFVFSFISCMHHHLFKVRWHYVKTINKNLKNIGPTILKNFPSDTGLTVFSIQDLNLRGQLAALGVEYLSVTYKSDSLENNLYQKKIVHNIERDSVIKFNFNNEKNGTLFDSWKTENQVWYFFAKKKPIIFSENYSFSNITRRINDSVSFERMHYPKR